MMATNCRRLQQILRGWGSHAQARTPSRIHIVGGAGTGKSTFARALGQRLDLPVYALDEINFSDGIARRRPRAERLAGVHHIALEPGWIAEGIFVGWTDELLQAADLVIWLDLPARIALWRIVKRHVRASIDGTNRYPGIGRLLRFLRWTAAYYRPMSPAAVDALPEEGLHSRAAVARHAGPYRYKLIRCAAPARVTELLACLSTRDGAQVERRSTSNARAK